MPAHLPVEPVHVHAFLIPGTERPCECHDGEAPPQHAGSQHRGFSHADNRNIEEFARAEKARITERGDDGGVVVFVALRQHLKRDRAADLSLRARRNVRHPARGCRGRDDCPARSGLFRGGREARGDIRAGVRIKNEDAHYFVRESVPAKRRGRVRDDAPSNAYCGTSVLFGSRGKPGTPLLSSAS